MVPFLPHQVHVQAQAPGRDEEGRSRLAPIGGPVKVPGFLVPEPPAELVLVGPAGQAEAVPRWRLYVNPDAVDYFRPGNKVWTESPLPARTFRVVAEPQPVLWGLALDHVVVLLEEETL